MQPPLTEPDASSPGKRRLRRLDVALLGTVLLAAIPVLYLAATQFVEYDGYCYIFGAGQDRWSKLVEWYGQDPHPPLYYFLLRAALHFGTSHLTYRAVSILTGLGTVYLVGLAASKTMRSSLAPVLTALAFGLALPTIVMSCEVRAYMLCTFFLLLSYCALLDVLARRGATGSLRARIVFAAAAALACLSDYYAFFYVAAALFVSALFGTLQRSESRWKAVARDAATFAPVLGLMTYEYFSHGEKYAVMQGHLLSFYYGGAEAESVGEYLLRNLRNLFNLFSPWPAPDGPVFLAILAGLLLAAGVALWLLRRLGEPDNRAAMATMLAAGLILAQLMLAGALGKYPFGGLLRQQFLLFPFLVLCAFFISDRLFAAIPSRAAYLLAGLLSLAIVVVSYWRFDAFPKVKEALMTEQIQRFERLFPAPAAVYLDRFNLIAFFLHHDDWKWEFDGQAGSIADVDVYRVSRGERRMLVFRDKRRWILDCGDATLYDNLAGCMRSRGLSRIDLFRLAQDEAPWETGELSAYRKSVTESAGAVGLCVQELLIQDRDVYAEVRTGGCFAPPQR